MATRSLAPTTRFRPRGPRAPEDLYIPEGTDRRRIGHDRALLFATLRARGFCWPWRAGQYPGSPLWRRQRALRGNRRMSRIAIVGCGLVGSGWAIVFARAGNEVALYDSK